MIFSRCNALAQRYELKKRSERKAEARTAKEEEKVTKAEQMKEKELREYKNLMKVSGCPGPMMN